MALLRRHQSISYLLIDASLVCALLFRSLLRATIISSVITAIFFYYGHIYDLLLGGSLHITIADHEFGLNSILFSAALFVLVSIAVFLIRTKRDLIGIARGAAMLGACLVFAAVWSVAYKNTGLGMLPKDLNQSMGVPPIPPIMLLWTRAGIRISTSSCWTATPQMRR